MEYRKSVPICDGWETIMAEEEFEEPEKAALREGWIETSVPHNWDHYHGYHGASHGNLHGTAWYRRTLAWDGAWKGKRVFLFFEGVGSYADIWVNGLYAGGHKGGRTCFSADITDFLKPEGESEIYVRARHPEKIRDLPWVCGGCYGTPNTEGSQPLGIFRPVSVQATGDVRVAPFGVCITTPALEGSCADVEIHTELENRGAQLWTVTVRQELLNASGRICARCEASVSMNPGETRRICQLLKKVQDITLWFPEHPVLYRLSTVLLSSGQSSEEPDAWETVLDSVENSFGFRKLEWENFDVGNELQIDPEKLAEEPSGENQNFVTFLRGSAKAEVAVIPGGVKVYITEFSGGSVRLSLETTLENHGCRAHTVQVESFVQTFNRTKSIANLVHCALLEPGERLTIIQECGPIQFPDLWSAKNPFLHNVITTVRGVDEVLKEYCQTSTPFRICAGIGLANKGDAFLPIPGKKDAEKRRLLINGKPYFLNGSCEYEHELGNDHSFTDEMVRTRMKMFVSAGFNAFREAHCPHNLRYLEFCEQNGILYWAQMGAHLYFDTEEFRENFRILTLEWLRERRNSPSVILWGLQNESMLPTEFARRMTELIHGEDITSPTQRKVVTCNGGTGTDWNIPQNWSGTYGGTVEDYGREALQMKLVGEYGQYRVKGKHSQGSWLAMQNSGGDVSEELFAGCLETKVREAEKIRDSFYGHFQWIFTTHANPGREVFYCLDAKGSEGVGVVNNKGLFTCWGEPTDAYFMYRANYVTATEAPVLYLVSHSWPDRFTEPGRADIAVYSNCDEVELYNDYGIIPLGRKTNPGKGKHFIFPDVPVAWGILTAKGYLNGKQAAIDRIYFPALPLPEKPANEEKTFQVCASDTDSYRVNCGSGDYTDKNGFLWSGDRKFTGEGWGYQSWEQEYPGIGETIGSFGRITDEIENTADQELFRSFRYGREKLRYSFRVKDGAYKAELYFAEPWYGTAGEDASGWRLFDVAVNGSRIGKVDIWKETGGARRALKKSVCVRAENGWIHVTFPRIYSNQALINAIRITPVSV